MNKVLISSQFLLFLILFDFHEHRIDFHSQRTPFAAKTFNVKRKEESSISKDKYYLRYSTSIGHFLIKFYSKFEYPAVKTEDSTLYFIGNEIHLFDKTSKTTQKISLENIYSDKPEDISITDYTEKLHFKQKLFGIHWRGDSDVMSTDFVQLDGQKSKELFSVIELVSIRRSSEWYLKGFVKDRDEVVSSFEDDYPILVNLKTYTVKEKKPPIQYIGYPSQATEDFHTFKMLNKHDSIPLLVKATTEFMVDTLYRKRKTVQLLIGDSIVLHAPIDSLSDKIKMNDAG